MPETETPLVPLTQGLQPTGQPAPSLTLPNGQTLVREDAAPQSIQDAIKAAREARQARETTATAATETPAEVTETPVPADGATDGADAEGEEVAETEGAEASAEGEGEDAVDESLVIELPARTPNGEPVRIVAPDQETAEAFQRLQNGYMRGEQAREAQAASREVIEEFEEFRESLQLDPLSVIESALSVDQGELLARSLLANPAIQARLGAELQDLLADDEATRERFRLKAENQRAKLREQAREQIEGQRAVRANARDVNAAIGRLVPADYTDEQKEFFFRDAMGDIEFHQRRTGQRLIAPNTVAQILAPRLKALGIDPAARRDGAPARGTATRTTPAAAKAPAAPSLARAPRTVETVQANADKRRLVAAAAPGATSVGRQTPLDQIDKSASVQDAIRQYRKIRRAS